MNENFQFKDLKELHRYDCNNELPFCSCWNTVTQAICTSLHHKFIMLEGFLSENTNKSIEKIENFEFNVKYDNLIKEINDFLKNISINKIIELKIIEN